VVLEGTALGPLVGGFVILGIEKWRAFSKDATMAASIDSVFPSPISSARMPPVGSSMRELLVPDITFW